MKKLICAILIPMLVSLPSMAFAQRMQAIVGHPATTGSHAMTVVHSYSCHAAGTSPLACTITATTAGNSVLLFCMTSGTTNPPVFTPSATQVATYNSTGETGLFYISGITTGTTSISIAYQSFSNLACAVWEAAGLVTPITVDKSAGVSSNSGTGNATAFTGSVTTTNANDVLLGYCNIGASTSPVAGTGYAMIQTSISANEVAIEYKNVASATSYNPGMTWTSFNTVYCGTAALELN